MTSPADIAKKQNKAVKTQKKPYIRKEHLTDRPFKDSPELVNLRARLAHPAGKGRKK